MLHHLTIVVFAQIDTLRVSTTQDAIGSMIPEVFSDQAWLTEEPANWSLAKRVPTMLAEPEQRFYTWATQHWMTGIGEVVDLGSFIGGSTARLALGHALAGHSGKVHAYDRFTADEGVKRRTLYKQGIAPFEGNDIFGLSKDLLSPWADRITFHRGEIETQGWTGEPIEILCIDAFKKAVLADIMVKQFFPALVPGKSIIIHQDFLHHKNPWLAAQMINLRSAVTPVAFVQHDTMVFLVEQPMRHDLLSAAELSDLTDAQILNAIDKCRDWFAGFDLDRRLDTMSAALRANPGVRIAWQMRNPPK